MIFWIIMSFACSMAFLHETGPEAMRTVYLLIACACSLLALICWTRTVWRLQRLEEKQKKQEGDDG